MRLVRTLGIVALIVACDQTEDLAEPVHAARVEGFEAPDEVLFTGQQMTTGLEWSESAILAAPAGATRIGMLIDVADPAALPRLAASLEVRGFTPDGAPLAWVRAEVTWSEDRYLVARSDPGQTIHAAQLRVPAGEIGQLVHVAFAAVIPDIAEDSSSTLGQTSSALSVAGLVQSRAVWKARATKCTSKDGAKKRMAIHHTFTPPASGSSYEARIRSIQAYHMDTRGWCDIGYHFLVADDGRIYEGRPIDLIGAHVSNNNTGNIGISFVGCFQTGECSAIGLMTPSAAAIQNTGTLMGALADQYGIAASTSTVKGHMQHSGASTSCPGDRLLSRLPELLSIANGAPAVIPVEPDENPGEVPAGPVKKGRVIGVVFDASITADPAAPGSKRIPGAIVSLSGGQTKTAEGVEAMWQFGELDPGTVTILATAQGYVPAGRSVTVVSGGETWASIGLVPAVTVPAQGPATIRVKTAGGSVIANAVLKSGDTWLQADAAGVAVVPVPASTVSVTVWAPGYESRSVQAKAGGNHDVVLPAEQAVAGSGTMQGVVWDAAKTALPDQAGAIRLSQAIVVCSCGKASKARLGDAYWAISAPGGSHTFTAFAAGYGAGAKTAPVVAGSSEWASIGLVPMGGSAKPAEAPPAPKTVCYPGATGANDLCFQLVPATGISSTDYAYPKGLGPQYPAPTWYLDLATASADSKVAKNFALKEFMEPSKGQWAVYAPKTIAHWQKVRSALGVALTVNSGYRSPGWNSGVDGSAEASRHMWGDAADVTANGKASLTAIKNACVAEGADFTQMYTTHVHCDWRNDPLDPNFFAAASKPGAGKPGHTDEPGSVDSPASAAADPSTWTPAVGDVVLVEAHWVGFDEGTPWISWTITGPDGLRLDVEPAVTAAFEAKTPGEYQIHWDVGGMVSGAFSLHTR